MRASEYIYSKGITLSFLGIGALLLAVFMACGGTGIPMILTAELFLLLLVAGWLLFGYCSENARFRELERIRNSLEEKYLLGEVLPPPVNASERRYYDIMKTVSRAAVGIAEQAKREKEEYCEYVESWIHEIKTPLTACSLILANGSDPRRLKGEIRRADNLTESILYYARLRSAEKDTHIRKVQAASLLEAAVKGQMELLIAAGIGVETEGDFMLYTDDKAVCFMLGQLLTNCAKYCPGCHIRMTAKEGVISVRDDGIGIPDYELSRITDRGFTGTNGRRYAGSTGMGLYLVKELCGRIGIGFSAESEVSRYTCISLSFPGRPDIPV